MGHIKTSFGDKKEAKSLFQKLLFYYVLIEKPKIKGSRNVDLLRKLLFYDELNIMQRLYGRSYKVEIVDSKDLLAQLEASKSSIKDLFWDLLGEIKAFKYQITVKISLKKHKQNGNIEFAIVYFNSTTKTD